jgi:hypothetical protein
MAPDRADESGCGDAAGEGGAATSKSTCDGRKRFSCLGEGSGRPWIRRVSGAMGLLEAMRWMVHHVRRRRDEDDAKNAISLIHRPEAIRGGGSPNHVRRRDHGLTRMAAWRNGRRGQPLKGGPRSGQEQNKPTPCTAAEDPCMVCRPDLPIARR